MPIRLPDAFETPGHRTLFLSEGRLLRLITWSGDEVLLPAIDLFAYLLHSLAHQSVPRSANSGPRQRVIELFFLSALSDGDES